MDAETADVRGSRRAGRSLGGYFGDQHRPGWLHDDEERAGRLDNDDGGRVMVHRDG
jgi:hypothetical protein